MQKLVTIYLDNTAYLPKKTFSSLDLSGKHGLVEEHLQQYLAESWTISSVSGFGGAAEGAGARGWAVAVLEKK